MVGAKSSTASGIKSLSEAGTSRGVGAGEAKRGTGGGVWTERCQTENSIWSLEVLEHKKPNFNLFTAAQPLSFKVPPTHLDLSEDASSRGGESVKVELQRRRDDFTFLHVR